MSHVTWIVNRMHVALPRMDVLMDIYARFERAKHENPTIIRHRGRALCEALRAHRANGNIVRRYRF